MYPPMWICNFQTITFVIKVKENNVFECISFSLLLVLQCPMMYFNSYEYFVGSWKALD